MADQRPVVYLTADTESLYDLEEPVIVLLQISREEIERQYIGSVLERLLALTDSKELMLRYRERLIFTVAGYDSDPRELAEIEPVRDFFKRLTQQWPHWLWFLSRDFGSIGLLLALLIKVDITREGGGIRTRFVSEKEQKQVLFDLFSRGNALFRAYDLPVEECDKSADSALASIYRQ